MINLTIFTIATGKYWNYFQRLLPELSEKMDPSHNIQIIVLTDKKSNVSNLRNERLDLKIVYIENEPWPQITLMRYHKIIQFQDMILGKHLMWLDVDTSLTRPMIIDDFIKSEKVHFVLHPGFQFNFRFLFKKHEKKWLVTKSFIKGYFRSKFMDYGWERRKISQAFVPLRSRRKYVFGTMWLGQKKSVLDMARKLSENIDLDLQKEVIAIWHDESHLNWYSRNNAASYLPKNFIAYKAWAWNLAENATVHALDKDVLDYEN